MSVSSSTATGTNANNTSLIEIARWDPDDPNNALIVAGIKSARQTLEQRGIDWKNTGVE